MRTTPRTQWSWQGGLCFFGQAYFAYFVIGSLVPEAEHSMKLKICQTARCWTRNLLRWCRQLWLGFRTPGTSRAQCAQIWVKKSESISLSVRRNVSTWSTDRNMFFDLKTPYFQIEKLGCVQDVALRVKPPCHKDSKGLLQLKKTTNVSSMSHVIFTNIQWCWCYYLC